MNRSDLQRLSRIRIKEAKLLLDGRCYNGAYYLAGYAVECALKACIAKQTRRHDFPDKKRGDDSYTHDLFKLVKVAKLENELQQEIGANRAFRDNWTTVKKWSEAVRYETAVTEAAVIALHAAITDQKDGVLPWLKKFW
jgi:HEPN domain-containing protein